MNDFYQETMDRIKEENHRKKTASIKKHLPGMIAKMSDEDVEYLFQFATNIKTYKKFETSMRTLFGKKE